MLHEALTEKKMKTHILTIADLNLTYIKWSWAKDLIWLALYENYINGFSQKNLLGKWSFWYEKWCIVITSASSQQLFFKLYTMKQGKR